MAMPNSRHIVLVWPLRNLSMAHEHDGFCRCGDQFIFIFIT